jgi:hypothetical protein
MRIIAVCSNCQRDLLLSQLVEGSQITGRCPWCGTLLAPRYTLLLATPFGGPSALAQSSSGPLSSSAKAGPGLQIRPESVLDPIRAPLPAEESPSPPVLRQAA